MISAADSNPAFMLPAVAAYNNGYQHGAWIDADQYADEIRDETTMLARSPIRAAEE